MSRFISWTIFFVVLSGIIIHFGFEIPYVSHWIGELPGDLVITKGKMTIYVPLASSVIASLVVIFLGSLFTGSK